MNITPVTKEEANFQVQTYDIGKGKVVNVTYFATEEEAYELFERMTEVFSTSNLQYQFGIQVLPANPTPAELLLGMF
jgi:hypothetical protein